MANTISIEVLVERVSRQEDRIRKLEEREDELEARLARREQERADAERSMLIRGIMFLGSIITALVGVIWAYRAVIFQGRN